MRRLLLAALGTTTILGFAAVQGCGSAGPGSAEIAGGDVAGGSDAKIAGGGEGDAAYDAPPHRFEPRSHPPHRRPAAPPPPDLSSLPPVKLALGRCFGRTAGEGKQIAVSGSSKAKTKKSKKPGRRSSGQRRARGKRPAASKPSAGAAPGGAGGGGAGKGYGAGFAEQPPAPQSAPSQAQAPGVDMAAPQEPPRPVAEEAEATSEIAADRDDEMKIAAEKEEEEQLTEYEDWGAEIYLSNDDTMSLSSAQRVIYAIDNFLPLPLEHIRPHELLNYFSFETAAPGPDDAFSVLADIGPDPREEGIYTLALSVAGPEVTRESRRNTVLTWVVDRSGSMSDEGRMEYLKRGLMRSLDQLKHGDIVHMVVFDHDVCVPVESFVVGRDERAKLERAIDLLEPRGATDIHSGLSRGYDLADRTYQAEYTNRVVLVTDALTNTGVTDERMISMISKYYDKRRIRLSGVGVGRDFNDSLLDRLTERGKGAYVFLGSEAEVDAVFGGRFLSLIETTALDVHFLLHLPESLRMNVFYGEESSTVKEDVQAIHYFANTSQLFLSDLMARGGELRPQDDVMLTIEYEQPETGEERFEEYAFDLGEISGAAYNVRKGRLVMAWIDLLAAMAARPLPPVYRRAEGMWEDAEGWRLCEDGRAELERLAGPLLEMRDDREVRRVLGLWDKYCARYDRPRNPVKRRLPPGESWPGAAAEEDPR
ncbi:MAG: VWA domain-containing protein [Polyangia bacterium]